MRLLRRHILRPRSSELSQHGSDGAALRRNPGLSRHRSKGYQMMVYRGYATTWDWSVKACFDRRSKLRICYFTVKASFDAPFMLSGLFWFRSATGFVIPSLTFRAWQPASAKILKLADGIVNPAQHLGASVARMEPPCGAIRVVMAPTLRRSSLYTSGRSPSFRHGLPESSHREVNLRVDV